MEIAREYKKVLWTCTLQVVRHTMAPLRIFLPQLQETLLKNPVARRLPRRGRSSVRTAAAGKSSSAGECSATLNRCGSRWKHGREVN
jgi:hypothetical protein